MLTNRLKRSLRHAMKELNNRKAPGLDTLINVQTKYGGEALIPQIRMIFNNIINEQNVPEELTTIITILLHK